MNLKQHVRLAKVLVRFLDTQFEIAGFRFGLDPILGLIPQLGNILTTTASLYLFYLAWKFRVPRRIYARMILTILTDFVLTSIPFVGNFFDFFYKSNERNLRLLSRYFDTEVMEGQIIS